MASAVMSARTQALTVLRAALTEDVLDYAPLRYSLPYVAEVGTGIALVVRLDKATKRRLIELTFEVVTDPHDPRSKTLTTLTDEVDTAMTAALDLSGDSYSVEEQDLIECQVEAREDDEGAELKVARMTWQLDIVDA